MASVPSTPNFISLCLQPGCIKSIQYVRSFYLLSDKVQVEDESAGRASLSHRTVRFLSLTFSSGDRHPDMMPAVLHDTHKQFTKWMKV